METRVVQFTVFSVRPPWNRVVQFSLRCASNVRLVPSSTQFEIMPAGEVQSPIVLNILHVFDQSDGGVRVRASSKQSITIDDFVVLLSDHPDVVGDIVTVNER